MATEKIVFEVETKTGNSAASVKSVKAELRALQNEMAGLQVGSDAFVKAAQKAGQLKDQIEDANMAVKAFNPEAKFQAFAGVLGGVANGFSAVQGAMALFGTENKDVEKAILQTQGAIAIATGINGLMGMKDAFIILGNVIKTQVVAAFATMRAAIISTGILGLVVLIGTLIYSWMEEADANEKATEALKKYGEENERIQKEVTKTAIAGMKGRQKEMTELQDKFNQEIVALYKDENKSLREKNAIALELNKQLEIEQQNLKDKYREEDAVKRKDAAEKEKERLKKIQDAEQKALEDRLSRLKLELEANSAVAAVKTENARKEYEAVKTTTDAQVGEIERLQKTALDYAANEKNSFADRRATLEEYLKAGIISQQQYADASVKITEQEQAAKLSMYQGIGVALTSLSQLVGEQTSAGKALAVAGTTIDTYVAAFRAYKEGLKLDPTGTYSLIAAAAATATGLSAVRKIMAVKTPNGGGGGSGPSSIGGATVPQFNPALATQVQGGGDVTLGAKPIPQKVYVVESDIRTVQNKVSVIEGNSKIG